MNKGTTIFIPVYNEAKRIENAIRSAAPQCERLLVSDNASSDGTADICRAMLKEYPNMEFFQQESNIGALHNWFFLLSRVNTPYVMALGSHDSIESNYVASLQKILESNSDTVLAVGELFFQKGTEVKKDDAFSEWRGGDQQTAKDRVNSCIFDRAPLCWAVYGLFRTETMKRTLLEESNPPYGVDIIQLAKTAAQGKIKISHNTRYYAWVHNSGKRETTYLERLLGQDKSRGGKFEMRNQFRQSLFQIYISTNHLTSRLKLLSARYRFMVRIGMFKSQVPDLEFYLLYLPVKLSRRLIRGV
jgi:glycosyltransferase involved in cell wall biosynthesis